MGKDAVIRRLQQEFKPGKSFDTAQGRITVREFNDYLDPEEGLFRFADIAFVEEGGDFAGRFVFRASSNDPTFVCSYEAPLRSNEEIGSEPAESRRASIGGLVLDWLDRNSLALISNRSLEEGFNISGSKALEESRKLNLVVPSNDLSKFRGEVSSPLLVSEESVNSTFIEDDYATAQADKQGASSAVSEITLEKAWDIFQQNRQDIVLPELTTFTTQPAEEVENGLKRLLINRVAGSEW